MQETVCLRPEALTLLHPQNFSNWALVLHKIGGWYKIGYGIMISNESDHSSTTVPNLIRVLFG